MKNQLCLPMVRWCQHRAAREHHVQEKILDGTGLLGLREGAGGGGLDSRV